MKHEDILDSPQKREIEAILDRMRGQARYVKRVRRARAPKIITASRIGNRLPAGELVATCWCEESYVSISAQKIKDGQTESCGLPHCHA